LSTIPAIGTTLLGAVAALWLRRAGGKSPIITRVQCAMGLLLSGLLGVASGLLWNLWFPINKKLWTSSYVLCTVGIALGVLAILVYMVPQAQKRGWTYFFEVFGRNTLIIYLLSEAAEKLLQMVRIGPQSLLHWVYAIGFASWAGDKAGSLLYAVAYMLCCWAVAYAMDRKGIYIKL